ncbi:malolactic enzyme [Secundilactobacillus paracollinoides]|uniref:Malolactic enzyme n=1 Tax=Secundilactobacillus paracollinoides TaxID=240427 RepID=A0A1B2IXX8_9LACO|nr:malolactic enzyme [Secundilactobacillus paracollinoides]ANZ61001.1 NAD-dependent malic enzyme [Secundilactobacillus paracollinoides]ANZ66858.1 NAD-dependent malic enzyme [Secundilactobacillus paracollinoides]
MTASILNDPFQNKGIAFTMQERHDLGLEGLLPPYVETLDQQTTQAYAQYQSKPTNQLKRQYLMTVFNENRILFYNLFSKHVAEFMPIVYDPTIADTIEQYSHLYNAPQEAAFLSIDHPENIAASLKNAAAGRDIRLIVVTDAEGILGIGDWGTNGVAIAVGKLMVYTAAAGIDPKQVLPVMLDAGTNNQKLLADPLYLGNHHARITGDQYDDFVDQFVTAAETEFPNMYLHFEDFGRSHAAKILKKYQDRYTIFNDDIQGTGIIVLAAVLGALAISKQRLTDQTYLCFGAGSAGAGIAKRVYGEYLQAGLTPDEAKAHFYLVDKQGLLFDDDPTLTPEQKPFARNRSEFAHPEALTDLASAFAAIHPTILVGTSTQPGTFTEAIVKDMAAHTDRPIIMPLSNPTKLAEAKAEDLLNWTDGRALVATGIPTPDVTLNGVTYQTGQANNALVYPGLGLGVIAANATTLNAEMISAAAHSLGGLVDASKPGAAVLPPVTKLAQFSTTVAEAVAQSAVDQHLTKVPINDVKKTVADTRWTPTY